MLSIPRQLTTTLLAALLVFGATTTLASEKGFSDTKPTEGPVIEVPGKGFMVPYEETVPGAPNVKFKMTPVPGGTFLMGSPEGEELREDWEGPQFTVEIEPFWMGTCEVTWDEYLVYLRVYDTESVKAPVKLEGEDYLDAVSLPTPQYEEGIEIMNNMGPTDGRPAVDMTQLAAKQYTKWLSMHKGDFYRLPTEAEWEYACRAGSDTAYAHADNADDLTEYAWFFDNAEDKYQPVGSLKPNAWGLYDMHGNVSEWVIDQFSETHYEQFVGKTLKAADVINWPTERYPRVCRGGSWYDDADMLRSAARMGSEEDWKAMDPQEPKSIWWYTEAWWNGFRIIRPLNEPETKEEKRKWWTLDLESDWELIEFETKHRRILVTPAEEE
jgi:formylglycine-generating enzyme required for sulfatase activity